MLEQQQAFPGLLPQGFGYSVLHHPEVAAVCCESVLAQEGHSADPRRPTPAKRECLCQPWFPWPEPSAQGFQKAPLCLAWTMAFLFPQIPLVCMRYMTDSRSQAILRNLRGCMGQRSGIVHNCSRTMFQIVYFLKLEVHCLHTEWL